MEAGCDSFVGGQKHDAGIARGGRGDKGLGGKNVVVDGSERLFFVDRNVLVSGCVKEDARTVERKNLVEERAVRDIAEVKGCAVGNVGMGEVLLKIVETAFRGFEKDDAGTSGRKSESQRGTDRASCTGNENGVTDEG